MPECSVPQSRTAFHQRDFEVPMNISTLRVFCDVVLHQSFSRGASANEISQSAATQSIHRLEKQLGASLLDRAKRPFVLTPAGQLCYESFRDILEAYDNVVAMLKTPQENVCGQIRVAAIYSVGLHEMSLCMKSFIKNFPKARVRLEFMHPNRIYQAVLNSEIDIGIVSYPMASQEIDVMLLRSDEMVLVCPPRHPLTEYPSITPEMLQGCDFVAFDRNLIIRKETDRFLRRHGLNVKILMEFDNIETIKQAIETEIGISFLPAPTVQNEVEQGKLKTMLFGSNTLRDRLTRPIGIIHRHRKIFDATASRFIEMLTTQLGSDETN